VRDVLAILERRAADEANLIFRRHREEGGKRTYTEISDAISVEINALKAPLFAYFEAKPDLAGGSLPRALLAHLPRLVRESPVHARRVERLPSNYRSAILAAEIATTMIYRGGFEPAFEDGLHTYASKMFT
jgi:glutamate dehydrogenase